MYQWCFWESFLPGTRARGLWGILPSPEEPRESSGKRGRDPGCPSPTSVPDPHGSPSSQRGGAVLTAGGDAFCWRLRVLCWVMSENRLGMTERGSVQGEWKPHVCLLPQYHAIWPRNCPWHKTRRLQALLVWFWFFLIDVFVFAANHKKTWEKSHWWGEGEGIPSESPVSCYLVPGWSVAAFALGCVLVSAISASLGQPWHLFHQVLSRNCPNFPDRRARCCQISSWSKASNPNTTLLPALAM